MARSNEEYLDLGPLKGQNSTENPMTLGPGWATDTLNVELEPASGIATKRLGASAFAAPTGTYLLHRHVAAQVTEANADLFAFVHDVTTGALRIFRKIGGAAFLEITVPATITDVYRAVSFNGKMFLAGFTTNNRLHVWDGTSIRVAGLKGTPTTAPTAAVVSTGTYTNILRYYKVQYLKGILVTYIKSELTKAVSITNSGTTSVTRPASGYDPTVTHWAVWGSTDDVTYYFISGPNAIATATINDPWDPLSYYNLDGRIAPLVGTYMPPPSPARIITDGHRLILGGMGMDPNATIQVGELPASATRVWYTPVLSEGDEDEYVVNTLSQRNYIDVGENTIRGIITELAGPIDGQTYVFQKRRIWRLVPTGDVVSAFLVYPVTDRFGANALPRGYNVCAVTGEDYTGHPAIYFLDTTGVYRIGNTNIEFVAYDIRSSFERSSNEYAFLFANTERKQLWLVTQRPTADPVKRPRIFVFQWDQGKTDDDGDIIGGWVTWEHASYSRGFQTGHLHNREPGTASIYSETLVPHMVGAMNANLDGFGTAVIYDEKNGTRDVTTPYMAYIRTAPFLPTGATKLFRVGQPQMICRPANGSVTIGSIRDFGTERRDCTVSIAPTSAETNLSWVIRTFEGLFQGDVTVIELYVGDQAAIDLQWQIGYVTVPVSSQEPR